MKYLLKLITDILISKNIEYSANYQENIERGEDGVFSNEKVTIEFYRMKEIVNFIKEKK